MYILGINAFHGDSSAAILRDGKLVAAVEEERFRRIKHWAGFPSLAIQYCLDAASIGIGDVDHVALNSDPSANLLRKVMYTLRNRPDIRLVLDRLRNRGERKSLAEEVAELFPDASLVAEFHNVEHHLAHLASAYYVSPFKEAVVVSVDGFGDFSSGAWGIGRDATIKVHDRVYFPHSLGIFYQAMTQFIGFPHYGDEYKVMGLAPYGQPAYLEQMREIVKVRSNGSYALNLRYFRHHREKIDYEWSGGSPRVGDLFSDDLAELIGFPRREKDEPLEQHHRDLAHSAQAMYEEAFMSLLQHAHEVYGLEDLALAGGCAMNSVANGKVYRRSPFRNLYIQPAAGDAGGAIGSALVVAQQLGALADGGGMDHAYWGPAFEDGDYEAVLQASESDIQSAGCSLERIDNEQALCETAARAVADGCVVGWFQGRMEWGPRALGNRSILGDPRREDMKDILNSKIKRRESFRPFAPSILREAVPEWFEEDDDVPFMMQVFQIRESQRAAIPAVTHVDGSGRLQTVSEASNPRYYRLIKAFGDATGVPIVLNTSFNENEPIVCRPDEALDCFLRTKMDMLVLGDYVLRRAG